MNKKKLLIIVIAIVIVYFMMKKQNEDTDQTGGDGNTSQPFVPTLNNRGGGGKTGGQIIEKNGKDEDLQEYIATLTNRFVQTCNNHGGIWNPGGAAKHGWDTTTLNEMMSLSDSALRQMNAYFQQYESHHCNYPDNYSSSKSRMRTSLSDAIPSGTLCKYRTGASTAYVFKDHAKNRGC